MRRLRRIFGRTELTREEVKLLRGIARQTLWAASRAGLDVPAEDEEETSSEASSREAT
jgi:tRNA C32,U32 (ribose-2'-O)-methylase TrmJ